MNNSTADRWIVILLIMVSLVFEYQDSFQRYGDNLRKANFPERNRLDIEDFLTEA